MINELANWMITMLMTKIGWKLNNNNSILKWYGSRFCFFSSLYFCLFVQLDISSFPVIFFCCLLVRFFNWKWKRKSNSEKTWLNKNVPYCLSKRIFCFFGCWWWYSLKTKNKIKNPDFQKKNVLVYDIGEFSHSSISHSHGFCRCYTFNNIINWINHMKHK